MPRYRCLNNCQPLKLLEAKPEGKISIKVNVFTIKMFQLDYEILDSI
jgi:hypothetical protein